MAKLLSRRPTVFVVNIYDTRQDVILRYDIPGVGYPPWREAILKNSILAGLKERRKKAVIAKKKAHRSRCIGWYRKIRDMNELVIDSASELLNLLIQGPTYVFAGYKCLRIISYKDLTLYLY